MSTQPTIAILGTGNVGGALGATFGKAGYAIRFGTRDPAGAAEVVLRAGADAKAASAEEAVKGADVIFVALPARAAVAVLVALGSLAGKVIVDCTNPVGKPAEGPPGPAVAPPPEGSVAAAIQKALPGARVLKGFNCFGAEIHANPRLSGGVSADVLLAGDDDEAKKTVSAIAERAGFVPVDAGPLRNAALLEHMALVWIHLAMVGGKGRDWSFKMLGR
jgi:8-hydroxy-5-deazaflavin:NADPH oxidoreductase